MEARQHHSVHSSAHSSPPWARAAVPPLFCKGNHGLTIGKQWFSPNGSHARRCLLASQSSWQMLLLSNIWSGAEYIDLKLSTTHSKHWEKEILNTYQRFFFFLPLNIQQRMAKNPALEFWNLIELDRILEFTDSKYVMKGTEPGWFLQDHVLSVSSWKQTRQLLIQKAILETCTVFLDNHSASQICQGQSSNKLKPR